jgi:hypothetical protein
MGAWGYGSMENDDALEWLANSVEWPMAMTIKNILRAFIAGERADILHVEVEAAVALLVKYADASRWLGWSAENAQYEIELGHVFAQEKLWHSASEAVEKMLKDEEWLQSWTDPGIKKKVPEDLLSDVRALAVGDWGLEEGT